MGRQKKRVEATHMRVGLRRLPHVRTRTNLYIYTNASSSQDGRGVEWRPWARGAVGPWASDRATVDAQTQLEYGDKPWWQKGILACMAPRRLA